MDAASERAGSVTSRSAGASSPGGEGDPGSLRPKRPLRPFLKWAGGKRQLLPALRRFYPARFQTYHEPFLGSGAVFFDLVARGAVQPRRVRLTDVNSDLIGCWRQLRDDRDGVITHLQTLATERAAAPATHYYQVRDDLFNPARAEILNGSGPRVESYTAELAAMLIYLNRTGFNGLFRVNSRAEFNVPRGRYANPRVCDEANLRHVSDALSGLGAAIEHARYDAVLDTARRGDFVYLDPSYAPLSATASFTSYTAASRQSWWVEHPVHFCPRLVVQVRWSRSVTIPSRWGAPSFLGHGLEGRIRMSKEVRGMVRSRRVKGAGSARTEGARRATGVGADPAAVGAGALAPGQRWSASRKRDVVVRLLRGESLDTVSREVGVELYRLEAWKTRALAGLELGLKAQAGEPLAAELDAAKRHIGELSMENELLRERARAAERRLPLTTRRSRR